MRIHTSDRNSQGKGETMETLTATGRRKALLLGAKMIEWYLLKKGEVTIPGFGKFYLSAIKVKAAVGDADTKEVFAIRFKPSAKLKGVFNG